MTEFPVRAFGAGATLERLLAFDCDLMVGIVSARTERWAVLAVDELDGGTWVYLTVPIGPSVAAGDVLDPSRLRDLLTDATADVRELTDFPSGLVHVPVRRPIPNERLPSARDAA